MRVLVGCEVSGLVRDAFTARGHYALSCDLLGVIDSGPHYAGDVFDILGDGWDLGIFHPPCTYLASSGNRWLYEDAGPTTTTGPRRWPALEAGARFFRALLDAPIPRVAVENPRMNRHATAIVGRGPDQIIQPWEYGHPETKATGLWLRNLPPLRPLVTVAPATTTGDRVHNMTRRDRAALRSTTYPGIADAMADQWGRL